MVFKGLRINTHRGILEVDFNNTLAGLYEELGGVPHVLLRDSPHMGDDKMFNGLKVELTEGITASEKINLLQSYRVDTVKDKFRAKLEYRRDEALSENNWELITKYKYAFIQPAIHIDLSKYYTEYKERMLSQYEIMKRTCDRLTCIVVNLDELTDEDSDIIKILTDSGEIDLNSFYQNMLIINESVKILNRNVVVDRGTLEGTMLIMDEHILYIIDCSYITDEVNALRRFIQGDKSKTDHHYLGYNLTYPRLSRLSGNPIKLTEYMVDGVGMYKILEDSTNCLNYMDIQANVFGKPKNLKDTGYKDLCHVFEGDLIEPLEKWSLDFINEMQLKPYNIPDNYVEKGKYINGLKNEFRLTTTLNKSAQDIIENEGKELRLENDPMLRCLNRRYLPHKPRFSLLDRLKEMNSINGRIISAIYRNIYAERCIVEQYVNSRAYEDDEEKYIIELRFETN